MKNLLLVVFVLATIAAFAVACGTSKKQSEQTDSTASTVNHPEWSRNAVIYEVNMRQYTPEGTFKAFEAYLPQLKELGVDILWFMPIHPISELNRKGELGSYYAVKDYKAVNPEYGTLDDFKSIVDKAHSLGMKVILDWVPNHSGCDNAWVTEHPDWYVTDSLGKMYGPYDWTDVYKFDYSNKEMRAGMIDALQYWVRDIDIDGYRCDVAGEVPTDFWEEARPALDSIKPVFMLAEADKGELAKNAFDMLYNWPLKDVINRISASAGSNRHAIAKKAEMKPANALTIDTLMQREATEYPGGLYFMNMITNHDENSWDNTEHERLGDAVEAYAVLTYTLPGMPLIYTGQEVGFNHMFEFFIKDPVTPDWTKNATFEFYKKLNALKHNTTALNAGNGAEMVRYPTSNEMTYVFSRTDENGGVYALFNFSGEEAALEYTGEAPQADIKLVNYFTGEEEALPATLPAWGYRLYTVAK